MLVERLVAEFGQGREDLLDLLSMEIKKKIRNQRMQLGSPNSGSGNGGGVSPIVGFCVGKGVGNIVGGGIGMTSTNENVISVRILKKFSARSGPPSSSPVPQGGL
jgi:hypothetical protein